MNINPEINYNKELEEYKTCKQYLLDITKGDEQRHEGLAALFEWMEEKGFTTLPASIKYHLNYKGGLMMHSMNVTTALLDLTNGLGLQWQRPESPIIVGMLHDLCKLEFYKPNGFDAGFEHDDSPEYNLGGHGMLSVVLAQRFIKLTDEEIHCIRFHMGAYEQKDWSMYDAAIRKYPNVLYTHTADMIASKITEE